CTFRACRRHCYRYRRLPCPLYTFFFSCSVDHRHLHSFPTRRSSDLIARELPRVGPFAPTLVTLAVGANDLVRGGTAERYRAQVRDRKSTRLNSSHVAISYAAFCLKKKRSGEESFERGELGLEARHNG